MKNKRYIKSLTNRLNRLTLFTICFAFSLFSVESAMAVTGAKNIPADYLTLQAAISDLNATGSTGAGVTLTISAGNPQTAPVGGYVIGGAGSLLLLGGTNSPISINGGLNTITAGTPQVAGSLNDAVIKIVGADDITIFNCTILENPANSVTVAASNGQTEFGIALFYADPTDGAKNITIRNNDISLKRLYQNSFGIYSSVRHTAAAPTAAADISAASGSNSNLHVYTNAIHNVSVAVASIGSASLTAGLMNDGTDIGGSSFATGNTFTDWGNPGTTMSAYVSMTTGSYPCVYSINEINNNISFNSMVSANLTLGGAGTLFGVFQTYSGVNVAPQPSGIFFIKVDNNTFTLVNSPIASGTGAIECIRTQNLAPAAGATISISNNTVSACKIIGPNATSSLFRPIINTSSPSTLTIDANIIKDNELNTTTGQCQLLRNSSNTISFVNIRNNKLGIAASGPGVCVTWTRTSSANFFMLINSPGAINSQATNYFITGNNFTGFIQVAHTGFLVGASITVGGSVNYNFNTFTNLSLKNGFIIRLLSESGQKPGSTANYLNNSVIGSFTNTGVLAEFSLYLDAFDVTSDNSSAWNFSNNNFSNISFDGVGSDWIGVYSVGGNGKKKTASNNIFNNISVSANAVIENILRVESGSSLFANTVSNNIITNISSAGGNVTGIYLPIQILLLLEIQSADYQLQELW